MATKLRISESEYKQLRALGKTKEEIIAKYSTTAKSPLMSAAEGVTNFLGLRGAVDTIGTNLAGVGIAAKGLATGKVDEANAQIAALGRPTMKQNIGAGVQIGSLIAPGVGAGASLARAAGGGALLGATSLAGQAAAENRDAGTIATQGVIGGIMGAGVTAGARAVQGAAKEVFKFFIPRSKAEAVMIQNYRAAKSFTQRIKDAAVGVSTAPRTVADTAFAKGIAGTEPMMGVQAKRAQSNLWNNLIKPQLESATDPVDLGSFFSSAKEQIVKSTPELTRQKALLTALESIVEDYADTPSVTLSKLQDLKSGWAEFVPEKVYRGENIAGAVNDVRNTLAGLSRKRIYDSLGSEIRTAYLDYGNLTGLKKLGTIAMTGQKMKGGTGGLLNALVEKVMVPISTVGGLTVYKVGKGIELIGRPGLNTVGQFILDLTNEDDLSANK